MIAAVRSLLNILSFLSLLGTLKGKDAPCKFTDTVALDPTTFVNESYLYDNNVITIRVPANETGDYQYDIEVENQRIPTVEYKRGCICKPHQPCISICCADDNEYSGGNCTNTNYSAEEYINITTNQGKTYTTNIFEKFIVQYYRPCTNMYSFVQNGKPLNYLIFENGSLLYENRIWSKAEYCMNPLHVGRTLRYYPSQCFVMFSNLDNIKRDGIVMLISVPFMLLTILIYTLTNKISSLATKSTCFYLLSLSLAFTTLAFINLGNDPSDNVCSILGYTTYFAFIASYSWLTVISFNIYYYINKRSTNDTECKIFTFNLLFGFGLPTLLLGFAFYAQKRDWELENKPNIGGKNNCFIEQNGNNKMIYFFGPGIFLISLNVIMFFLTIKKLTVGRVQNALEKSKLQYYLERSGLFARLFLIMGVAWWFEFLSYCYPGILIFKYLLILVQGQGYFIFILVILSKEIRPYLIKWYRMLIGQEKAVGFSSTRQTEF